MDFSAAIDAQLRGEIVRVVDLVEFGFKSGTQRYWQGEYTLTTGDGKVWAPTMGYGNIEGFQQSFDGEAPEIRLELSGIDAKLGKLATAARDDYFDRMVVVYWGFFDAAYQPLSTPYALIAGRMQSLICKRQPVKGGYMSSVTLTAETPFSGRATAPFGFLTPQDQEARYPSPVPDKILSRSPGIDARRVIWPKFALFGLLLPHLLGSLLA